MVETAAPRTSATERAAATRSLGRLDWSTWPKYEAAAAGFRGYWYPVTWSRKVGRRPIAVMACGETIMLIREKGRVRALHDRCPHRGVPLSHPMATQEFPGTWTCCYHGWTFDLESGTLVAAITDGPDSPICGKVAVKTYPVEERLGLVWLYIGNGDPPPVETDIPAELLEPDAVIGGRRTIRVGNWRFGAENGIDEGHAKFLHRNSLWTFKRQMPTWVRHHMEPTEGGWITRVADEVHFDTDFPGYGSWPPKRRFWRQRGRGGARVSIKLPCTLRVQYATWTHFEWWIPIDAETHIYLQLATQTGRGIGAARFRLFYWSWVRWVFHGMFNEEDALMVDVMDAPPERLYRPDIAITEWRKLCEADPRGRPQAQPDDRPAWERLEASMAARVAPSPEPEAAAEATSPVPAAPRVAAARRSARPTESAVRDATRLHRRGRLPITHRIRKIITRT
jgi:phenylpropionate dioxygenase-like ring-hydroxylating dioxygenase large terminal subunit